jgi:hypothetical protein
VFGNLDALVSDGRVQRYLPDEEHEDSNASDRGIDNCYLRHKLVFLTMCILLRLKNIPWSDRPTVLVYPGAP